MSLNWMALPIPEALTPRKQMSVTVTATNKNQARATRYQKADTQPRSTNPRITLAPLDGEGSRDKMMLLLRISGEGSSVQKKGTLGRTRLNPAVLDRKTRELLLCSPITSGYRLNAGLLLRRSEKS